MSASKISVVIPIYNVEDYLADSLASLQQQTYRDFEAVMVNDGSTDHSQQVAEKYLGDKRFKLVSQLNQGLSAARNTGMRECTGDYLYFLDPDDQIAPNLFETAMAAFENGDVDLVAFSKTDVHTLRPVAQVPAFSLEGRQKVAAEQLLTLLLGKKLMYNAWSYIAKRRLYTDNKIGFPVGKTFEDVYTTPRVYANAKTAVILRGKNGPYFYFDQRQGSIMDEVQKKASIKQLEDRIGSIKTIYRYLGQKKLPARQVLDTWYFSEFVVVYNWYYSLFAKPRQLPIFRQCRTEILDFYRRHDIQMDADLRKRFLKVRYPVVANILKQLRLN